MLEALLSLARNAVTRSEEAGDADFRAYLTFAQSAGSKDLEEALVWGM